MEQKLVIKDWSGGIATIGEKKDVSNSSRWLKNLNPFESPDYITLARKPTKVSGTTVTGLPHWAEDGSPWATDRYFYGSGGKIYKETSGGSWSSLRTVSGSTGCGLKAFDDYLYYSLTAELGRYGLLSGTPAFDDSFLSDDTNDLDQSLNTSGQTYTTPTTISEAATARQTFVPTKDPLKSVEILVAAKGTGDWTVTVHDSNNTLIGAKTLTSANVTASDDNKFTFATPLRLVIGNSYHFHVTSTVANGTVTTTTTADLETVDFHTYCGILISATWHPMVVMEDTLIIGNERYLATWDQSTYTPNKITFAPGFQCRALAKFEEYVVAATFKGATVAEAEAARLYIWDGISSSFNFFTEVTMGAPNAIHNAKGTLLGVYGSKGSMYRGREDFEDIIAEVPKLTRGTKVEIYPGAMTEFEGNTLIGVSASTDDSAGIEQGVYEYGRQQQELPEALNFPFTISTGTTQGTTLKIGMVKSFGTDLYIGWRDDTAYGVDKIALGDGAMATGSSEGLIFDAGDPDKQFLPLNLILEFEPLTDGQSLATKYKLDRGSYVTSTETTAADQIRFEQPIFTRCREIEFGFNLASSSNTFIKVTELKLTYDDLAGEAND